MMLNRLVEGMDIRASGGNTAVQVEGISTDSRRVEKGELFVALRGEHADGRDFIGQAVSRGAVAVMCEDGSGLAGVGVPYVVVDDARDALASVSSRFYENPSETLTLVGVTGTNGKTTTTYMLRSILEAAGINTGLIGTISYCIAGRTCQAPFTTPEPPEFQGLLKTMLEAGATHVVAEVSSHALALKRVDYTKFKVAVFTNLTRDHLDFHHTMEEYFSAKRRLFDELLGESGTAVINIDDPYGGRLRASLRGRTISVGRDADADLRAVDIENDASGLRFNIAFNGQVQPVNSALIGEPNVYNMLVSAGAALALGLSWDHIARGIGSLGVVEGRFERVDAGQDFLLIVDYAHTDDALRRLILSARDITRGRVITVFGCGGERDRGKRPRMGSAAAELSDLVIITSDNPRGEDPERIIKDIVAGVTRENYRIVPDRAEAIAEAVNIARTNDTVLIAGKGHEDYQIVKGERVHFSDREVAEEAIIKRMKKGA